MTLFLRPGWRWRPLLAVLALLLAVAGPAAAASVPVEVAEWTGAGAPPDAGTDEGFVPFDPTRLHRLARSPDGLWLRVRPATGAWPDSALVLVFRRVVFGAAELYLPGSAMPLRNDIADAPHVGLAGEGMPVFELPRTLPRDAPLLVYLHPHPTIAPAATIAVEPLADYMRTNALWIALASACLAAMSAMALIAVVFLLVLRDRAYLFYALYLGCFVVLEAISTGYLFTVLRWHAWAPVVGVVGKLVTIGSVVAACLFLLDFTRMRRVAPAMHRVLLGYMLVFGVTLGLGLLPQAQLMALARALINPLLALGAVLLPVGALVSWIRGSRYGAYFLLGWLPLMAATFMTSMQVTGAFDGWLWLDDSLLVAGSFEALVLAVGLADRALAHRRRFHHAERLSMTDPLTGLLNRRAWEERFPGLALQAQQEGRRVFVLFIDLDHFKSLNDSFGHRAGDEALSVVAQTLTRIAPEDSLLCRYGGEEFVVALSVSGPAQAHAIAETLRASVASRGIPVDTRGDSLSLSIGLARHRAGDSVVSTVEQADRAMYRAKAGGRNRVMEAA